MRKVQPGPLCAVVAGIAALAAMSVAHALPPAAAAAGAAYLLASNALLARGLARHGIPRFGWANTATATRSGLVGLITALVTASLIGTDVPVALLTGLVVPALALDAVDGWLARRTGSASELGARFDMEVDAFLLLVLSVYVAAALGPWVLAIGLMRYAYVAAGRLLPWLRGPLPYRYWRKVVAAMQGIALAAAASGLLPPAAAAAFVLVALALLVESFGRDVLWLRARQRDAVRATPISTSVTAKPTR